MSDIIKTVDIHIGSDAAHPKLGVTLNAVTNSHDAKANLSALKNVKADGVYFLISIQSTHAEELRSAFQTFLETAIGVAKEMSPEIDQVVGDSFFEVVAAGDRVIAAVNIKDNPIAKGFAD